MKKITLLFFILTAVLLLNSCNEKKNEKPEESTTQINTGVTSNQQDMGQTMQVEPQQVTPPQEAPQQVAAQPGQKLNPPHGQPGHDCKIPVGAPLGSGSSTGNVQPAATQGQQMTITPPNSGQSQPMQTQQTKALPGQKLNPPHGQPGHDCKIPVGAPLK